MTAAFGLVAATAAVAVAPPPILSILENVSRPSALAKLRSFYAPTGAAQGFRVYLDDACGLPADWRKTWDKPLQWGLTGDKNWATKYGAQGFIPRMVDLSPFATADWRAASASIVVLFARQYAGGPAIVQQQCLQRLRARSEAWRATNGSRHFFIFTDSRGPCCLDGKYKDVDFLNYHVIGPHGEPDDEEAAAAAAAAPVVVAGGGSGGGVAAPALRAARQAAQRLRRGGGARAAVSAAAAAAAAASGSFGAARGRASAASTRGRTSTSRRRISTSRGRRTRRA